MWARGRQMVVAMAGAAKVAPSSTLLAPLLLLSVLLSVSPLDAVPLNPSQVNAIMDLYHLAQLNTSALPSSDCTSLPALSGASQPFSIQCDTHGFVLSLNMSFQKLSGRLSYTLGTLSLLQSLDLQGNKLQGPIPGPPLANLKNMQHLNLAGNQLSSSIPEDLSALTSLTFLFLGYNMLSGSLTPSLSSLTHLSALILRRNSFLNGNIPSTWGSMTALTALDLGYNQLSGSIPDTFSALSGLQVLSLGTNQLSGIIPSWLGSFSSLQLLDLGANKLTSSIPDTLGQARSLVAITLDSNQLQGQLPDSFSSLQNLGYLYAVNNQLVGGIPESYARLQNLRALDLSNNAGLGTDSGFPTLLAFLPKLQSIRLAGCGIKDQLPEELEFRVGLVDLHLSNNKLYGQIPSSYCALQQLQNLDVSDNTLSGPVPTCLASLQNLQLLSLQNNLFTGIPPQADSNTIIRYDGNCLDAPARSQRPTASSACQGATRSSTPGTPLSAPDTPPDTPPASPASLAPPHPSAPVDSSPAPNDSQFPQYLFSPPVGSTSNSSTTATPIVDSLPVPSPSAPHGPSGAWYSWLRILLVTLLGALLLLLTCAVMVLLAGPTRSFYTAWKSLPPGYTLGAQSDQVPVTEYSLSKIKKATKNFTTVFGKGSFGNVFLGEDFLRDQAETRVVVKRSAEPANVGEFEFRSKVEQLAKSRHPCCVNLLGYCTGKGERILVFEYMPNGTLFDRLHRSENDPLPWEARVRIAVNIACALEFLHSASPPMVHKAVTSSNILLTADMSAKLADYGLARGGSSGGDVAPRRRRPTRLARGVSSSSGGGDTGSGPSTPRSTSQTDLEAGAHQHSDQQPQQRQRHQQPPLQPPVPSSSPEKLDVYGFGVVLLELITGQKAMKDVHITSLAAPFLEDAQMMPLMVDAALGGYFNQTELIELGSIARDCVKEDPSQRPTMRDVVAHMEAQLSIDAQLYHSLGDATDLQNSVPGRGPYQDGSGYTFMKSGSRFEGGVIGRAAMSMMRSVSSSITGFFQGGRVVSAPQTPTKDSGKGDMTPMSETFDSESTNSSTLLFITPKSSIVR